MALINGRTITLIKRSKTGVNTFGEPVYAETQESVYNVLITPTSAEAVVQENAIYGKHSVYTLHIPKGDSHDWDGAVIVLGGEFGTRRYKAFGDVTTYQSEYCPLDWNRQVRVELYE